MADLKHSEPDVIWLTPEQLAVRLGVETDTLAKWRAFGKGPKYRKLPGCGKRGPVRYRLEDVLAWEGTFEVVDPAESDRKVQEVYEHISAQG